MRGRTGRDAGRRWAAFVLAPVLLGQGAWRPAAATIAYDVAAGVSETDNVRLTPTDKRSDTTTTLGFDLDWHEMQRLFQADVMADLNYLRYLRNSYSPGVVGNFLGNGRFNLIPEKFTWMFSDNFGQQQINPLAPVTPENRENVNYFSTGPDVTLPLGSVAEMLMDGRYSRVSYQTTPLSSNRYTAGAGVRRELSSSSAISINAQDELIRFAHTEINPDYDQQLAYLRYNAHGVRTRFDVQVGIARLKLTDDTTSMAMARAEATRQLSPFSSLTLTAGHEYSDAGDDFRLLQALGGANLVTQAVQSTAAPFKNDYVTLAWKYQRERTGFGLDYGHYGMNYIERTPQSNALSEKRNAFGANATRRLTPLLDASLIVTYERDSFVQAANDSNMFTGTAQLTWRASQRLSVITEYAHQRRQSEIRTSEYQDNVVWLRLTYGRVAQAPTGSVVPQLPVLPNQTGY